MTTQTEVAMPATPEHDKFSKSRKEALGDHLARFYDYLRDRGIRLMEWHESDEEVDCEGDFSVAMRGDDDHSRCGYCHGSRLHMRHFAGLVPTAQKPAQLIAGYLGIDHDAFNAETEAVYAFVAAQARRSEI